MLVSIAVLLAMGPVSPPKAPRTPWVWGVTIDNLDEPDLIRDSLKQFPVKPMARVVFDETAGPDFYREALGTLKEAASIMGEPIDSVMTKKLPVSFYRDRMKWYMAELANEVDIWEIGNEVNGDWGGESPDVAAKVTVAWREAKKLRRPTALTLFYSSHYQDTDRDMAAWSEKYLDAEVRSGIDYVLVSFYPQDEAGEHPDWKKIFGELAVLYPKAKLGFGELGLAKEDFTLSTDARRNLGLAKRYYEMKPPIPERYIGGYFWWSFRTDGVPSGTPIWNCIADAMRRQDR